MSGDLPPVMTAVQLANIAAAMTKVSAYISKIQAFQQTAANTGNLIEVQNLTGSIQDAIALQQQLVYLHSIPNLAALNVAITTANQTVAMINIQKTRIDGWVKTVKTAATVLDDIAAVVTAVAKI
jgi:hypothetical protein